MDYKEALLKPKPPVSALSPAPQPENPQDASTPSPSPASVNSVTPSALKLPSVEYFAGRRERSTETYSIASTENTARSKGITPTDSWADDDDEFMASLHQEALAKFAQQRPAGTQGKEKRGWKEVGRQGQPVSSSSYSSANGSKAGKPQNNSGPAQLAPTTGGRFDALAPGWKR